MPLDDVLAYFEEQRLDVIALHEAIDRLIALDKRRGPGRYPAVLRRAVHLRGCRGASTSRRRRSRVTGESPGPGSAANSGERSSDDAQAPSEHLCALFAPTSSAPPAKREVLLREACAGHPGLRTEVDRLLAGNARADEDRFLRVPDAPSSTQDQVCDRFEATWRAGDRPQIAVNPPPAPPPEIPGYEILFRVGQGRHGRRLQGAPAPAQPPLRSENDPRRAAHAGAEHLVRLLAEAQTIARIRHPNVVQIYGLGDHDGRLYFEMEYIEGGDLAHRLNDTPWAPRPAAQMVAVLARAVEHAHRLGIVHRDLKPANVLLMADGTPKIADFGLAKAARGRLEPDTVRGLPRDPELRGPRAGRGPDRRWWARPPTSTRWERSSTTC